MAVSPGSMSKNTMNRRLTAHGSMGKECRTHCRRMISGEMQGGTDSSLLASVFS